MIKKSKFKICKRLGKGVYDKCQNAKFTITSNFNFNKKPKRALSEYGLQLIEKQKIRFSYGITEKQLSNYVKKATLSKDSKTNEKFYEMLEFRLDNIVYRMGLSNSRRGARQMVSHGHFIVNNHKVTIPSYQVKVGDIIKIREGSKSKKIFSDLSIRLKDYIFPDWLIFDENKMEGKILAKPKKIDVFFDLDSVLEFYSR